MLFVRNRRVVATIAAAWCIAVPASASAGTLPSTYKSDAAQSGGNARIWIGAKSSYPPSGFIGGDVAKAGATATSTYPPSGFIGGDGPADRAGAGQTARPALAAPATSAPTAADGRPSWTATILAGAVLILAAAGLGALAGRAGTRPRRATQPSA